jgi:heme exporter protein A
MRLMGKGLAAERGHRPVFSGVDFSAASGELLAVTGPNGAGKTTLLRLIAGLIRPIAGTIVLEGGDGELSTGQQAHLIGHQLEVKPSLSVAENLRFWSEFLGGETLEAGLEGFGLERVAGFPAGVLSAGQRRRLLLARLLVAQRQIWLLDEPTNGLDQASRKRLAQHMQAHLDAGGLIIAATHGELGVEPKAAIRLGEVP